MTAQPSIKQAEHTRGQASFNETFLVLFIVVLIIFLGVFLYYKYSLSSIQTTAFSLSEEETIVLLASLTSLPELQCASDACLDTAKFLPFSSLVRSNPSFYQAFLGEKTITVEQLYPSLPSGIIATCTASHYHQTAYPDNCRVWILYSHKPQKSTRSYRLSTLVTLYFPEIREYRVGRMHLEVYR